MRGRTERAKMLDARQWRQHLAKVYRGLATKAPVDDEAEFVRNSLWDRQPVKLLPDIIGDRIELSPLKYQPRRGSQNRLKLAEQLVGYAGQQTVAIIKPAVYESMHPLS